jgi:hypothetical protein
MSLSSPCLSQGPFQRGLLFDFKGSGPERKIGVPGNPEPDRIDLAIPIAAHPIEKIKILGPRPMIKPRREKKKTQAKTCQREAESVETLCNLFIPPV